jgi:hypothetical protein
MAGVAYFMPKNTPLALTAISLSQAAVLMMSGSKRFVAAFDDMPLWNIYSYFCVISHVSTDVFC